jgi:hypothetical protein
LPGFGCACQKRTDTDDDDDEDAFMAARAKMAYSPPPPTPPPTALVLKALSKAMTLTVKGHKKVHERNAPLGISKSSRARGVLQEQVSQ